MSPYGDDRVRFRKGGTRGAAVQKDARAYDRSAVPGNGKRAGVQSARAVLDVHEEVFWRMGECSQHVDKALPLHVDRARILVGGM